MKQAGMKLDLDEEICRRRDTEKKKNTEKEGGHREGEEHREGGRTQRRRTDNKRRRALSLNYMRIIIHTMVFSCLISWRFIWSFRYTLLRN